MAQKGDASGLYFPEAPTQHDTPAIIAWAYSELMKISSALENGLARNVEFLNVAPASRQ